MTEQQREVKESLHSIASSLDTIAYSFSRIAANELNATDGYKTIVSDLREVTSKLSEQIESLQITILGAFKVKP